MFDNTATAPSELVPLGPMLALLPRAPLVTQAVSEIRARVEARHWRVGDQLPSEPQLAAQLRISRGTLREAVRLLIADGVLRRRHGVGTFVARVPAPSIDCGIDELFSVTEAIEQMGCSPSVGECTVSVVPASAVVATELRLTAGDAVCRVQRVRLADGRPLVACDEYLDLDLLRANSVSPVAARQQIMSRGSIYSWVAERLHRPIATALARIEPVSASPEVAGVLAVKPGVALLRLRQTHLDPGGTPVLYSENLHNGELMQFHVVRRRARPAF